MILGILLFISGKCFSQISTNSFPYNCSFSILSSIRETASRIWRKRNEKIREATINFQNETSCYEELFKFWLELVVELPDCGLSHARNVGTIGDDDF